MPRKTRYLYVDKRVYDEIIKLMESFLKQHNARWKKSQDISTLCEGDKVLVNNDSITITAEVTLDDYSKWAEFYNFIALNLCSLAACKLPNHYFNTTTTYGPNDKFRIDHGTLNVNVGFVNETNIKYTYRIKIDFKKGQ